VCKVKVLLSSCPDLWKVFLVDDLIAVQICVKVSLVDDLLAVQICGRFFLWLISSLSRSV
jgi:hypothetical protein